MEGVCAVQKVGDRVRVLQADPRITISESMLDEVARGAIHPDISLAGDVLVIEGENRKVIYRLGDSQQGYRFAEWPD